MGGKSDLPSWQKCTLSCDGPVVDVRFAPAALGLKLAACVADGKARVFEFPNALDFKQWEHEDLETKKWPRCTSAAIDWMPTPFGGSSDTDRETLALAGRGGRLAIWAKGKANHWTELTSVEAHDSDGAGVKDVAWCPNLCREYEIIATCGSGAKLWRVDFSVHDERNGPRRDAPHGCQLQLLKELISADSEVCPVWRCSWNLTGTTLALCPEGTEVSVWKADAALEWVQQCDIEMAGN